MRHECAALGAKEGVLAGEPRGEGALRAGDEAPRGDDGAQDECHRAASSELCPLQCDLPWGAEQGQAGSDPGTAGSVVFTSRQTNCDCMLIMTNGGQHLWIEVDKGAGWGHKADG